jgi:hypothetical protein
MTKRDKEPFGKKTKPKPTVRPSAGMSPVNKSTSVKVEKNLYIPKEPARKAPKIDPNVNISGGASGRSFGGGGNINLPVVRKKNTLSIDVSGGGGGYKPKGGKISGGGEVSIGGSVNIPIGRTKKPVKRGR